MTVLEKVTEVVAEVLELDPSEVAPDANLPKELGLDSVLAIDVATALEAYYKVQLLDDQMDQLTSPRAIAEIVEKLLRGTA